MHEWSHGLTAIRVSVIDGNGNGNGRQNAPQAYLLVLTTSAAARTVVDLSTGTSKLGRATLK